MAPIEFIGVEWLDHLPQQEPGTAYLEDMIRSLTGARGLDATGRECAVNSIVSKLDTGKTLGDFTLGDVGDTVVKKGKLSPVIQPCASAETLAQVQAGTYVVAADLDVALPRRVLVDSASQAATDIGMNEVERDCAVGKVYGALTDVEILRYFTTGVANSSTASKSAVRDCVTGDRVLAVATKAKQQAQADAANSERRRQLNEAAIDRALSNISASTSAPEISAPATSTGP